MIPDNYKIAVKELIGKSVNYQSSIKKLTKNRFFIFCFHEITNTPSKFQKKNKLFVTKDNFVKQIRFISKILKIINPKELLHNSNITQAALISFDDGYAGSFNFALKFLVKEKIIPIYFLNMSTIHLGIPLLPASLEYLEKNYEEYENFLEKNKIKKPFHLSIKPLQFQKLNDNFKLHSRKINAYQGKMVNTKFLQKNQNNKTFFIADHLYEHYNCLALNKIEVKNYSNKSLKLFKHFKNHINFFSFFNGVPNLCFNKKNIKWLKDLNYKKSFACGNTSNKNKNDFLQDRISLNNDDDNFNKFLYKILISIKKPINII